VKPIDGVALSEVHRMNVNRDRVCGPKLGPKLFERARPSRDEHEIQATSRELAREGRTDPFGCPGDHGPGTVSLSKRLHDYALSVNGVSLLHIRLITYAGTRTQGAFKASTRSGAGVR